MMRKASADLTYTRGHTRASALFITTPVDLIVVGRKEGAKEGIKLPSIAFCLAFLSPFNFEEQLGIYVVLEQRSRISAVFPKQ